jgi:hypothetical protein
VNYFLAVRQIVPKVAPVARSNAPTKPTKTMKKNRYKVTRGKRQVYVVAQNMEIAESIARPMIGAKAATIKIQYVGHA